MTKYVGVLTSGGDTPGLNAAIRAIGKSAIGFYDMHIIGFRDGFRGLVENRKIRLDEQELSGILTVGGTILGTSRDKPNKMPVGNKVMDMTETIVENYQRLHLDVVVCLGGGGTQKNAFHLQKHGLNVITLPKTIDNDVDMTDVTFGFDTALGIATEAIDRLHSTAHSHHRIIICEVMGHNAGWLALGAGIAGGADVILIPEIPYNVDLIADAIRRRSRAGKNFSIVAVAEGAMSIDYAEKLNAAKARKKAAKEKDKDPEKSDAAAELAKIEAEHKNNIIFLAQKLEELTHLEARVSILGHVQRGGIPSAADRLLASRLGTACSELIDKEVYGVMIASVSDKAKPIPLEDVVGKRKIVPLDHSWLETARKLGTCLGDELKK
ncbi:MAG: ATP-dependent 6-phosphofructokinase [SAR324 cluster bacterium]|nr:ATP-dependent 6-phosphofructokinase [SAR324 cluster bacterium]